MCPPGACSERCAGWGFFASFHACERAVLRGLCVKVAQLGLFRGGAGTPRRFHAQGGAAGFGSVGMARCLAQSVAAMGLAVP